MMAYHKYEIKNSIACITIRHRNGSETVFMVDAEDVARISEYRWNLAGDGRIQGYMPKLGLASRIQLHRLINKTESGFDTDHVNRNPLDNRKSNLRTATRSQNVNNSKCRSDNKSSGLKGVSKNGNKWRARAVVNGRRNHIGYFDTSIDAYRAYLEFVRAPFGEFFNRDLAIQVQP